MKSIGFFWSNNKVVEKKCENCPYGKSVSLEQYKDEDATFDFQINLWNSSIKNTITGKVSRFRAIDFGVVCPLSTKKLVFLFPFEVKHEDFSDLAKCLSSDSELLCTVFNEDLKTLSEPTKSFHKIDSENSDIHYLMYELSKENIEISNDYTQTNLTQLTVAITSNFDLDESSKYRLFLRFRINLRSFDAFATKKDVSNDWLQSAFSSTLLFDIRLNDVRELSKKRKEFIEYQGFQMPEFSKIHFFYMADSEEVVENGSSMKLDKRLLENDRWHAYLEENFEFVSANIAHHWKKKKDYKVKGSNGESMDKSDEEKIKDFTIFFKTVFSDCRKKRVLRFLLLIVILGMISSLSITLISLIVPKLLMLLLLFLLISIVVFYIEKFT